MVALISLAAAVQYLGPDGDEFDQPTDGRSPQPHSALAEASAVDEEEGDGRQARAFYSLQEEPQQPRPPPHERQAAIRRGTLAGTVPYTHGGGAELPFTHGGGAELPYTHGGGAELPYPHGGGAEVGAAGPYAAAVPAARPRASSVEVVDVAEEQDGGRRSYASHRLQHGGQHHRQAMSSRGVLGERNVSGGAGVAHASAAFTDKKAPYGPEPPYGDFAAPPWLTNPVAMAVPALPEPPSVKAPPLVVPPKPELPSPRPVTSADSLPTTEDPEPRETTHRDIMTTVHLAITVLALILLVVMVLVCFCWIGIISFQRRPGASDDTDPPGFKSLGPQEQMRRQRERQRLKAGLPLEAGASERRRKPKKAAAGGGEPQTEEAQSVELAFQGATNLRNEVLAEVFTTLTNAEKLKLYGMYKQASAGDVEGERPGMFDVVNQAKWDAWAELQGMPQGEAKRQYVAMVDDRAPGWRDWVDKDAPAGGSAEGEATAENPQAGGAEGAPAAQARGGGGGGESD